MMRIFSRFLLSFLLLAAILIPFYGVVGAESVLDPACVDNPNATLCQENNNPQDINNNSIFGPNGILTKAARLVAIVVGIAAVIMIIVGGIQYVISAGDPTNVTNAKNTILYAIIGLVVALLAQAIIAFVLVWL